MIYAKPTGSHGFTLVAQQRLRASCYYLTAEEPILQSGVCQIKSQNKKKIEHDGLIISPLTLVSLNAQLYLEALLDICCRQSFVVIDHTAALSATLH